MTIASVPAILALVNLFKSFGVIGKWAMLLAVIFGGALFYAQFAFGESGAFKAIAEGILIGLAAAGLYDVTPNS